MYVAASMNELISLTSDADHSAFRKWKRSCHFWPFLGVLACDFASSSPSSFARQRPRRAPPPLPSVFFCSNSFLLYQIYLLVYFRSGFGGGNEGYGEGRVSFCGLRGSFFR